MYEYSNSNPWDWWSNPWYHQYQYAAVQGDWQEWPAEEWQTWPEEQGGSASGHAADPGEEIRMAEEASAATMQAFSSQDDWSEAGEGAGDVEHGGDGQYAMNDESYWY